MPASLAPVPSGLDRSREFARVFCSTLPHTKDHDGRAWGDCAKYLGAGATPGALQALAAPYRFLVVGGFGDACFKDAHAFSTSVAHLRDAHHLDVEAFAVAPFASSEENGRLIARRIETGWTAGTSRPYVLVGYDKGTADLLDALRLLPDPSTKVAAIVTVAGVVGGLWRPDVARLLARPDAPWMADQCPGNQADGLHSLARDVRLSFLRENRIAVPGYSIVAASPEGGTSAALRASWKALSIYAAEEDGVLVAWDGVLPGGAYLGTVRADHWAIALPFDAAGAPPKGIDRNRFPRDALLESLVRYVTTDLASRNKSAMEH